MSAEDISVPESVPVPEVDPLTTQMTNITELLDTLSKTSKSLTTEMKSLTKEINKLKVASTKKKKRVKKEPNPDEPRKLGALEKPVPITDELRDFLQLEAGELYSRQFITQNINKYVKENNLQNPENRRYILLDSEAGMKLKQLLRDPDQPLTFFNIQRYLKVHYPKTEEAEPSPEKKETVKKVEKEPAVVPDDADVAEPVPADSSEAPKKKVVRKVVKKTVSA